MRCLQFAESCVLVLLLVISGACGLSAPVVNDGARPAAARGTIAGTIRSPQLANAVSGRMVEAVNVTTGERRRVRTTPGGAYTFELPAGTWRIEPSLAAGERLDRVPEPVPLQPGQLRTDVDVVVSAQRPRSRTPEGLAPPFA
jgi:hypothetical protein